MGHEVTVYDKMEKAGGLMTYGIPHYRLPKTVVERLNKALEGMGVGFVLKTTVGADISAEDFEAKFDSIYVCTGAWKQPLIGIEGEKLAQFGLNFLVEVNQFLKGVIGSGSSVLVCGGGNVAMDVAMTAKRLGAKNVKLVCLEKPEEMPATKEEVERAKEEGIEIVNSKGLSRIVSEGAKIKGLETKECVSVFDADGRFSPIYDENEKSFIESDCIILAIGQRVDLDFLGERFASQIKSQRGLIDVELETFKTNRPGVYAGGDAVYGPSVAIKAIHAGRIAAIHMSHGLGYPMGFEDSESDFIYFDPSAVKKKDANIEQEASLQERTLTREDVSTLEEKPVRAEAGRCMNCGCYSVNASDLTPVLIALDATIKTTRREIKAIDLFATSLKVTDMLENDEIITEAVIPKLYGYTSRYIKFRLRDSIDFAMASIAYAFKVKGGVIEDVRVVLGGVAPIPLKLSAVERLLKGRTPSEALAKEAAALSVEGAAGIGHNDYKIQEVKTFVERMVLSMM
jgi:CO/xanthine dehydrogenase FAD-binding subunit/thioredoxin reductase